LTEVSFLEDQDTEYYDRLTANMGMSLGITTELRNGEHLRDAILRATYESGFDRTAVVSDLARTSTFRRVSAFTILANSEELARVVDVLGIRRDDPGLRNLVADAGIRTREYVSFFGHRVRRGHISNIRRVSPRSLRLDPYQKAVWSIRPLTFDFRTREELLHWCPECEAALGWEATQGVCHCDRCDNRVDLREFPQRLIESHDDEALSFVAATIDPEIDDEEFVRFGRTSLKFENRGDLFQFAVKMAMGCRGPERGGWQLRGIEPQFIEMAGRAILNWPNGFVELAEGVEYPATPNAQCNWFKRKPLRRLLHDQTVAASIRGQIKPLFDTLRRKENVGLPSCDVLSSHSIKAPNPGSAARGFDPTLQISSAALETLRGMADVRASASLLGLPSLYLLDLHSAGMLTSLDGPLQAFGNAAPPTLKIDVREGVLAKAMHNDRGQGFSLASARYALDQTLNSRWSCILRHIIGGSLDVCYRPSPGRGLVSSLFVQDILNLKAIIDGRDERGSYGSARLTQAEVGQILGKSTAFASSLLRSPVFNAIPSVGSVISFRKVHLLGFEIEVLAAINGDCPRTVLRDLHTSTVSRVKTDGPIVWSRAEVVARFGWVV